MRAGEEPRGLARLALKIFSMVPTAASIERYFSALGNIKTDRRNRMSIKQLNMLSFIRYCYKPEKEPAHKRRKVFTENDSDENASPNDELADFEDSFLAALSEPNMFSSDGADGGDVNLDLNLQECQDETVLDEPRQSSTFNYRLCDLISTSVGDSSSLHTDRVIEEHMQLLNDNYDDED